MVDLERILDLATPWCLHVAATLRIPEHIAAGQADITDLAAAAGCDQDALRRHPHARGILVDLPGTVARASQIIESFGTGGRMAVEGQSFFDPLPAGADLYLLKSVLNDWPDEPTVAILRRCAEAGLPTAAIAILGGVSADEAPRSLGIDMLVAGGKTSTLTQFTQLARQAGLDVIAARTQASGRFVVECRPARHAPPP